jgi:superfamily II DNA helicase RecQ
MELAEFPALIEELAKEEHAALQELAICACLKRILHCMDPHGEPREPHLEQVRTLRRLTFLKGDTLLIAKTGFGKSIIFHAFSILTGKMTLQIVPLSKLGEEQMDDIAGIPGTRPCVVTRETKAADDGLIPRITSGFYTHVLLGPEQASSKEFRAALKTPELQSRVGLVAIDECHLVSEWENFRPAFTMLGELRMVLNQDVVWFGCSASLPEKAEQAVLQEAGFRPVGPDYYRTEVIRTTIDRPDIEIGIFPIPRGKLSSFDMLYFLLDKSIDTDEAATPGQIPKTIVFIDNRSDVHETALFLQNALLSKTAGCTVGYSTDPSSANCVTEIVEEYTSRVSAYDRKRRYKEFKEPTSKIRIMVATTSLGMGVNVADVERTVLWDFPPSNDPADLWQKLGRGGRGRDRRSKGYLFLPYWAFDSEGTEPPGEQQSTTRRERRRAEHGRRGRRTLPRNMTPADRTALRSLAASIDDAGDVESVASHGSVMSDAAAETVNKATDRPEEGTVNGAADKPEWNQSDRNRRDNLSLLWKMIINAPCIRRAFLEYLGEDRLPPCIRPEAVPASQCCNRCNPSLFPPRTPAPEPPQTLSRPGPKTRAGIALQHIDTWMAVKAEAMYGAAGRRFPMTACAFLHREVRWQLAYLFGGRSRVVGSLTLDSLFDRVPALKEWEYQESYGRVLLEQLQLIESEVNNEYAEVLAERQRCKDAKTSATAANSIAGQDVDPSRDAASASAYHENIRRRDDNLAIQVARRNAERWKATTVQPTQPIAPSPLRESVTSHDAMQLSPLIRSPSPSVMLEAQPETQLELQSDVVPETQQELQQDVVPEMQLESQLPVVPASVAATPRRSKRPTTRSRSNVATPSCRVPLAEVDGNVGGGVRSGVGSLRLRRKPRARSGRQPVVGTR